MNDIKLNRAETKDAEEIFNIVNSCRNYLREWLPWVDYTYSSDDTFLFIKENEGKNLFTGREVYTIRMNGNIVGMIDLCHGDKFNHKAEIGYWLSERYQRKGIVTSACKLIINKAFNEYGINRITIRCATGNVKSRRIPERLNFKEEGIEREGELLNGRYIDLVVYSILKDEWEK